ncbi:hypothetical protein PUNSTDRAFT_53409 [Punctularia strigosozonata HHB-11173 SS5]|uniref:uncharacterized protein n=1 Tax=Punctularia strigosozonata (strain HHB-11173) TaxID=741275 RepID=UPI0004417D0C|nr:uncharacterized protein PUNSTDRAFT_53409 [Punctularia strigosozonata HHB-11173 SS5]EIN06985.1 hypothetical protein PUNSTDRAFT_53409 [Punctularia strigosozonata HHB-11173 SS5]
MSPTAGPPSTVQPLGPAPGTSSAALASYDPLVHETERFQRTWNNAQDIESDVDALQTSLNQLITQMGFDPSQHPVDVPPAEAAPDFDFDTFLNDFAQQHPPTGMHVVDGGGGGEFGNFASLDHVNVDGTDPAELTAFLDEVASQASDTASQKSLNLNAPSSPGPARKKRKSEVVSLNEMSEPVNGSNPSKQSTPIPTAPRPKKRK